MKPLSKAEQVIGWITLVGISLAIIWTLPALIAGVCCMSIFMLIMALSIINTFTGGML